MNIFENYLTQINKIILESKDFLNLENIDNLNDITLEIPPEHFNYDLSTNVCLVLAKANKISPNKLALEVKNILLNKINHFENWEYNLLNESERIGSYIKKRIIEDNL